MNPDVGPRCGACRLGLTTHVTADPLCIAHPQSDDSQTGVAS